MLDQLRNNSQSGIIYFLFGIIIIVFIFTFNTSGPGGGCTGAEEWPAMKAEGETLYLSDVDLAMRLSANPPANPLDSFGMAMFQGTRFARLGLTRPDLPSPYTPADTFTRGGDDVPASKAAKVAEDLVETLLVSEAAEDMGLRVTDEELVTAVRDWLTAEQGEFSKEAYSNTVRYGLGTTRQKFEGLLTRELLRRKMVRLVASQAAVSPTEVDFIAKQMTTKVAIQYVKIDAATVAPSITVSDADAAQFAKDNAEAITAEYTAREKEFNKGEQVLLTGIFKKAPFPAQIEAENDPTKKAELQAKRDDAKAELDQVLVALKAAEADAAAESAKEEETVAAEEAGDTPPPAPEAPEAPAATDLFAEKAGEISDDATRSSNGAFPQPLTAEALSRYPYGETVATAAFALEPGQVSAIVEVNRGYWLLRLEEKLPAVSQTQEQVATELARGLLQTERAPAEIESIANAVLEGSKASTSGELTTTVGAVTLSVEESLPFPRLRQLGDAQSWKQLGGVGCVPQLVEDAFSLTAEAPLAPAVYTVFGGVNCDEDTGTRVVARWASTPEPAEDEIQAAKETVEGQLAAFAERETYRAWYAELRASSDVDFTSEFTAYLAADAQAMAQGPLQ